MLINFKLRELNRVTPFGQENDQHIHWFALTDGDLWFRFGESTVYEYTKEAVELFADGSSNHVDYYIARFLEDFAELANSIAEPVPEALHSYIGSYRSLLDFEQRADKWLDQFDGDEFNLNYSGLLSWMNKRLLYSGHLEGGPLIWFFRTGKEIAIIWKADNQIAPGQNRWTSTHGQFRMDYPEFVNEAELFGKLFFEAMYNQVDQALKKDWGKIRLNKAGLKTDHTQRKKEFATALEYLKSKIKEPENWNLVLELVKRL